MVPVSTGRPSAAVLLTVAVAVKANSNVVEVPGTSSKVSLSRHGEVAWPFSFLLDLLPNLPGQVGHEAVGDPVVLAQGLEDGQLGDGDCPAALPHPLGQQGQLPHPGEHLARDGFTHDAP